MFSREYSRIVAAGVPRCNASIIQSFVTAPVARALCALSLLLILLTSAGCASYRGIPSHGGGKRFDEEQRVVSGAIRHTVAAMELPELRGRHAKIQVISVPTSGSGNMAFGGLQDISLNAAISENISRALRTVLPLDFIDQRESFRWDEDSQEYIPNSLSTSRTGANSYQDDREDDRQSGSATMRYRFDHSYFTQKENTEGDIRYLTAILEMKARHSDIMIDGGKPDCSLYVLVDVLGTNRRRRDYVLWKKDDLVASCEVTYYARDFQTGKLLFAARRSAGMAKYQEDRVWPLGIQHVSRHSSISEPTEFPASCIVGEAEHSGNGHADAERVPASNAAATNGKSNEAVDQLINRARAQFQAGNRQDALNAIEAAVNIDPNHPGLQELRTQYDLPEGGGVSVPSLD